MFKRKERRTLPSHIEYYQYHRDFKIKETSEEDKIEIMLFYRKNNINYEGLTNYQQNIIFKRTVNYIYIVAHYYDKKPAAKFKNPMQDGIGVVRTRAFIFYKSGELLYELDHDYQSYADNQIEEKKINKRNYELHDSLNNSYLEEIGKHSQNFIRFDKSCHELLKRDDCHKSVDFIKED